MSLIKQLWIGIILLLLLALGGSFIISLVSAKSYLEKQLHLKNIDNANNLALALTQLDKDPVSLELMLTAPFDAGHYTYIRLIDNNKSIIFSREFEGENTSSAPDWFAKRIQFSQTPGIAQVQDGWQQFATLEVQSHSGYAIDSLWHTARDFLAWFLFAGILGGLLGSRILKYVGRPLEAVILQAEAIGERRFITSEEPNTLEFKRLVRAMNSMSASVKIMLEQETAILAKLREDSQIDTVTGLSNREHFFAILDSELKSVYGNSRCTMVLIRIPNLLTLNTQHGRKTIDELLKAIAEELNIYTKAHTHAHAGRLNGSDFALLIPDHINKEILNIEILDKIYNNISKLKIHINLPIALHWVNPSESRSQILYQLDSALALAESSGLRKIEQTQGFHSTSLLTNRDDWRAFFASIRSHEDIHFITRPLKMLNGQSYLDITPALAKNDILLPTGHFKPWANRLGLLPQLDIYFVEKVIHLLKTSITEDVGVLLSAASIADRKFREHIIRLLQADASIATRIAFNTPEISAVRYLTELKAFAKDLRELGAQIGLINVGLEFTKFDDLQDAGLTHIEIDTALSHHVEDNAATQSYIQGISRVAHSLGMKVITAANTEQEKNKLILLGIDGFFEE
jgi:diguanylate cyclase (GGDEF)-like protein